MQAQPSRPPKTDTAWLNGVRGVTALIVAFIHSMADEVEVGFRSYFSELAEDNRYFFQLPPFRIIFADQAMAALFHIASGYSVFIKLLQLRDYAPRERFLDGFGKLCLSSTFSSLQTCYHAGDRLGDRLLLQSSPLGATARLQS